MLFAFPQQPLKKAEVRTNAALLSAVSEVNFEALADRLKILPQLPQSW